MPRPTIAELRQLLDDLGDDATDPGQFFPGTFNELLRVIIDAGPVKPLPTLNVIQNLTFASAPVAIELFDITAAEAGTIRIVKNLTIDVVTANIEGIRLQSNDGLTINRLWDDVDTPFNTGQYIGNNNDPTRAWGALGYNNIVLYPVELTTTPATPRQLQMRLQSAAAVVKTVTVSMTLIDFDSRLFQGGDW